MIQRTATALGLEAREAPPRRRLLTVLTIGAGMALLANGQVSSLVDGVKLARATLNEGKARHKLEEVVACSHALVR